MWSGWGPDGQHDGDTHTGACHQLCHQLCHTAFPLCVHYLPLAFPLLLRCVFSLPSPCVFTAFPLYVLTPLCVPPPASSCKTRCGGANTCHTNTHSCHKTAVTQTHTAVTKQTLVSPGAGGWRGARRDGNHEHGRAAAPGDERPCLPPTCPCCSLCSLCSLLPPSAEVPQFRGIQASVVHATKEMMQPRPNPPACHLFVDISLLPQRRAGCGSRAWRAVG